MSEFEGVEDILFIPLTARISVSKNFPEYFFDQKALEMEDLIKNKILGGVKNLTDGFSFFSQNISFCPV